MKRIEFRKGDQVYAVSYADVKNLINCLVDYADDPRFNLDLMDVFLLVHRLARQKSEELLRETLS
jgi:hypothetical protein